LLIEAAVLGCMMMLLEQPKPVGKGVIRFLLMQSLGMPFILLAGWFLSSGEITPINQTQLILSVVLLVLGFSFWIGLFPLHTWIHMVADEADPRVAGFIFSVLPLPVFFFLMNFLNSYAWLRDYPLLFPVLRWLGSFMVLFGGAWLFFQKQLKTSLGYLVITFNGLALLSLGIRGAAGITLLTYFFLPRTLSILLFVMALNHIRKNNGTSESQILEGLAGKAPFITLALIVSFICISGLPFFPGFAYLQMMINELVNLSYLALFMLLVGMLLLFLKGLQLIKLVFSRRAELEKTEELPVYKGLVMFCLLVLLISGLFPKFASAIMLHLADKFLLLLR
jgi:formate hydrogenlyase subunit 3/multisubunit Na+/H+ antiporter MnhD subunit